MSISGLGGTPDATNMYYAGAFKQQEQSMQAALFSILSALAEASSNALTQNVLPQLQEASLLANYSSSVMAILTEDPNNLTNQQMQQFLQGLSAWNNMTPQQQAQFPPEVQQSMNTIANNPNMQKLAQDLQLLEQAENPPPPQSVNMAQVTQLQNQIKTVDIPAIQNDTGSNQAAFEALKDATTNLTNFSQGDLTILSNTAMQMVNQIKMLATTMSGYASQLNDVLTQSLSQAV